MRLILIISLLASTSLYATEVYRSVDENGRVVFTNNKPTDDKGKHEVIDIEVKNKLGSKVEPSADTKYYRFPRSNPVSPGKRFSPGSKDKKLDMKTLQAKCEGYRNASNRSGDLSKQRKKRDYWCGRLHRGK